jgi:drug/metabolite transporter (DMT)-like permease
VSAFAVLLAAVSALVWGSADYCGGRASQRASAIGVTVISQLFGIPVLVGAMFLIPGTPYVTDYLWGAAAGVAGLLGIVLLYESLSTGAMSVAAPITAVTGALVPMGVGLVLGERPSNPAMVGIGCAIVAIALVSLTPSRGGRATPRVVALALGSGFMFGIFFVLISRTHEDSGMWPLVAVRAFSITLGLLLIVGRNVSVRMPWRNLGWVALAGMGDIAANALYLLAVREGLLSVVAPIAALYPVSTVLLAFALDKERVRPIQVAGLGLAATALVLTAV